MVQGRIKLQQYNISCIYITVLQEFFSLILIKVFFLLFKKFHFLNFKRKKSIFLSSSAARQFQAKPNLVAFFFPRVLSARKVLN